MNTTDSLKRWFGLKPARARTPSLGKRELAVLEVLWQDGAQQAQQVLDQLPEDITLSTVQSTLERLHRKALLQRHKAGRAYVYQAVISRADIISSLLHDMTAEISAGDMEPVVSGFIDYLADASPEVRSRLSRALEAPETDGEEHDA